MKRLLFLLACLSPSLFALGAVSGNCEQGGQRVSIQGAQSMQYVQRSYPTCTITVYLSGTSMLATIYSNSASASKSNPFVAATTGAWLFWANAADYDVVLSSAGIVGTVTQTFTVGSGSGTGITQLTGDGTAGPGSGAQAFTLVNIPTGTTQAGRIVVTAIAAPGSPSAGTGVLYMDSSSLNYAMKNFNGAVNHGVQTTTCSSQFIVSIANDGSSGCGTAVTSVAISVPTMFSVSGSPVTSTGTLALSYAIGFATYRQTTAPVTCATGDTWFDTDAVAGLNWFGCTSANTWTILSGGGSGSVTSVFGRTGVVVAVSGDYTGALVTNTPAGGISAITTQAAVNELDTEKQALLVNSAGLAAALSDETGTGLAVFGTSPTIVTPTIASFTNATHNHTNAAGGGQITDAAFSAAVSISKGGTGTTAFTGSRCIESNAGGTLLTVASAACGTTGVGFVPTKTSSVLLDVTGGNTNPGSSDNQIAAVSYTLTQPTITGATGANPMVLTLASVPALTTLNIGMTVSIAGALGSGCTGMNGAYVVTDISGSLVTMLYDNTGCTYTANSGKFGANGSATGTVYGCVTPDGAQALVMPSAAGLLVLGTGPFLNRQAAATNCSYTATGANGWRKNFTVTLSSITNGTWGTLTYNSSAIDMINVQAGTGMSCPESGGTVICSVTADVVRASANSVITGSFDLTTSSGVTAALVTHTITALSTTSSPGVTIQNTTAAGAGAQQVSPLLNQCGRGWKTNATAASQAVCYQQYVLPVQGTANPTATAQFGFAINGGSFASAATLTSAGFFTADVVLGTTGLVTLGAIQAGAAQPILWDTRSVMKSPADGSILFTNNGSTAFSLLMLGGTTSSFPAVKRSAAGLIARLADDSADTWFSAIHVAGGGIPAVGTCGTIGTGSKNNSGFITSGTAGACGPVITFTYTATTGWSCSMSDATTAPTAFGDIFRQTASSTTTATFAGVSANGDVLRYVCIPY